MLAIIQAALAAALAAIRILRELGYLTPEQHEEAQRIVLSGQPPKPPEP